MSVKNVGSMVFLGLSYRLGVWVGFFMVLPEGCSFEEQGNHPTIKTPKILHRKSWFVFFFFKTCGS